MTKQRFSDIEDAVLVGLLEAPEHDETPFELDPDIFTTPLKRKLATTINKFLAEGDSYMALFTIENTIDSTPKYQPDWLDIQSGASRLGFFLPVSTLRRYYDALARYARSASIKETR